MLSLASKSCFTFFDEILFGKIRFSRLAACFLGALFAPKTPLILKLKRKL
jgi:hypothetical protein